jgi:hypothetical protein
MAAEAVSRMGRVGPKQESGGNPDRDRGTTGGRDSIGEVQAEARIGGRKIDVEIVSSARNDGDDSGISYDNSPREAKGCLESLITLVLVLLAIGFPMYLVVMGFAGGKVPILGIEFEGSLGEGFLALAASPVIFFLILFLSVFIPGRARRIRMKRESRSDSRYR